METKKMDSYTIHYYDDGQLRVKYFTDDNYSKVLSFAREMKADRIYKNGKLLKGKY